MLAELGVVVRRAIRSLSPTRFAAVVVAGDVRVCGMRHRFGNCGLGVPVVGRRCVDHNHPIETDEQFFPSRFRIAATVLAAPGGGLAGGSYRLLPLGLVFHDPFRVDSAWAGGRSLPLAADRTTHLALQASQDRLMFQAIRGVISTEFGPEIETGLYMLRPYAPGKDPGGVRPRARGQPGGFRAGDQRLPERPGALGSLPVLGVHLPDWPTNRAFGPAVERGVEPGRGSVRG